MIKNFRRWLGRPLVLCNNAVFGRKWEELNLHMLARIMRKVQLFPVGTIQGQEAGVLRARGGVKVANGECVFSVAPRGKYS